MRRSWIGAPLAAAFLASGTGAQLSVSNPAPPKVPGVSIPGTGSFLMGADDCTTPHTDAGTGDVAGVPFTTGTTGPTGQSNAICFFFGTTGITNDVWFDWTATLNGNATFQTCTTTTIDTKAAIYAFAGSSSCPPGPAIACNDDACSLQTSVTWPIDAGTSYTIQLGTFPGAAGGTGTFRIDEAGTPPPPPCGEYDDGGTENHLGLTAGGEIAWMHYYTCLDTISQVRTAYGLVAAGSGSRIAIYEDTDCDGDATTGLVLLYVASVTGGAVNVGTDTYNVFAINPPVSIASGCALVAVTGDHIGGEFPGPMDQTNPTPNSWVMGNTAGPGSIDLNNPNANPLPPLRMTNIGFPTAWLLRATGQEGGVDPGTPTCFCEDAGQANDTAPPCGNGDPDAGCRNSTGAGALLAASGSNSVGAADLVLHLSGAPASKTVLFFGADNLLVNGAGAVFGDGHRCCGDNAFRLEFAMTDVDGNAQSTVDITAAMGISAGETRCFQAWVRDPAGSPCGATFGTSNAYQVSWDN